VGRSVACEGDYEKTKLPGNTILVSMDVTSLYTNIPQEEGITTVCEAYEEFYERKPPIPTRYFREMLSLQENSFQFNGKDYVQIHGTAMGTKMAVAFANIFMAKIENEIHKATHNQSFGKDSSMTLYPCGTQASRDKIEDFFSKGKRFSSGFQIHG